MDHMIEGNKTTVIKANEAVMEVDKEVFLKFCTEVT